METMVGKNAERRADRCTSRSRSRKACLPRRLRRRQDFGRLAAARRMGRVHHIVTGWVALLPNPHASRALPAWSVGRYVGAVLRPACLAVALMALGSHPVLAAEQPAAAQKTASAEVTKAVEQASSFMKTQKRKEAAEILDKVIPEVVATGDQALIVRALVNHAWACLYLNRYEDVIKSAQECVRLCGDYERGRGSLAHAENFAAQALIKLGRKEEAVAAYRAMFDKYRDVPSAQTAVLRATRSWLSYGAQSLDTDEILKVHRGNVGTVDLFQERFRE